MAGTTEAQAGTRTDEVRVPNVLTEILQIFGGGENNHLGFREMLVNAIGFGLLALAALATSLDNTAGLIDSVRNVVGLSMTGSMAVFLIALSFMKGEAFRIFSNARVGAVACAVNGALLFSLMALPLMDEVPAVALACALGIALGVTLGLMGIYWAYVATRMYIPDIATCAIIAVAGALVLYVLALAKLPSAVEHIVCALCPLASAPFLYNRLLESPVVPEVQGIRTYYDRRRVWPLFVYKVALPLLCVGVVTRIYLSYAQRSLLFDLDVIHMVGLLVTIAVAALIAKCAIYGVRTGVQSFARFLSVVIPLICLAGAPLSPIAENGAPVVNANLLASVGLILALSWTFLCAATLEYSYAPASTFGLGLGSFVLGLGIGEPILVLLPNDNPLFALMIGIVCFLMVFGFLPPRPAPNLSRSTYNQTAAARAEAVRDAIIAEEGIGTVEATGTLGVDSAGCDGEAAPACGAEIQGAGIGGNTGSGSAAGVGANATVPGSMAGAAAPGEDGAAGRADQTGGSEELGGSDRQKGRFVRRCEHVASMYLLSNRETEVLIHLAKGRSMNYIKDALVISEGTAKTHISHVYKKLDVHSRHELIELIESVEVD